MANPAQDDWGQGVPVADTAGAQDQWGTGTPVNENEVGAFTGDQAQEAVQTYAPGAQVTSAARTPQRNAQVGGVPDSMHMGDQAVDVVLPKGMTAEQFRAKLVAQGYPITEFINEGNHVHWGWGAKGGQGPGQDPWGEGVPVGKPVLTPEDNANIDALHAAGKAWVDQQRTPQPPVSTDIPQAGPDATQANLDQASKFYGGIWKSIKAGVQATPAAWTAFTGAMMRFAGEHPGAILPAEAVAAPELGAAFLPPAEQDKAQKAMDAMGQMGAAINAEATKRVNEFAPKASAPDSEKLAFQITRGTIDLLPVLAATELTANPVVGATMIAGQTYVQKYGEARAAGRSADQAALDSAFSATVNGSLGGLPLGVLMKPGSSFLGKTVQSAASFGAISVMTEALQIGYDKGLINPNMTLKEAWGRLEEAGITGTLQGALLGGGHAALESAVNRYMASNRPAAPRVEPTAAAPPGPPGAPPGGPPGPPGAPPAAAQAVNVNPDFVPPAVGPDGVPISAGGRAISTPGGTRIGGRRGPNAGVETLIPGTSEPVIPGAESIQAQVRASLGLDRPGRPPAVDEWGEGVPTTPAPRPAPEAAQPQTGGISRRVIAPDVAVTSSGREVPVHYAVVEARDLVPSQTQEGNINPNYPQELQPRDRTRAVSQAQVATIAQNINPRLLDKSPNASDGAPIVAPSGVVESGNGRTLAIQRAYEQNMQSAYQYRQYLLDQGYPVEGMDAPMLVRVRTDPMTPEDRQAFVREANQAGQLGYSATERAMSDAAALPDHALELYRGGDVESAGNRPFVRMFMDRAISANEHAGMVAADGTLSQEAIRRVRAALLAKAYGDPDLVAAVNESQDNNIKAIGGALTDSSAEWAKMRGAIARGEISPDMDQTANLLAAVKLVDRARADGRNVAEFVNQQDIFSGQALDPDVEAWLALMFRNVKDWTQPVGREKLADSIQGFAREAQKAEMGQNLLGEQPVKPGKILSVLKAKQYGQPPPEAGPSLRFGEDTRAAGEPGAGGGFESPQARGGQGAAQVGAAGRDQVRDDYGPAPASFTTSQPEPGVRADLTSEARSYLAKAGAVDGTSIEKIGALSNWAAMRGRQWGFESYAALSARNDLSAATSGNPTEVNIPQDVKERIVKNGENFVTVHNHPSGGSFSGGDLQTLIAPGHAAMVVVTHDGGWHVTSLAAKLAIGPEVKSTWTAAGQALKQAQERARAVAINWADKLYNERKISGAEANAIVSHIQMTAVSEAGIVHYQGTDVVPERYKGDVQNVVQKIAAGLRKWIGDNPQFGVRPADAPYRPAAAVQLAGGLQGVLEASGRYAGFAGSAGRQAPSASRPAAYVAPRQLRLLEDENRYEAERPPFYSALTRSVEGLGLKRAPAQEWLGAIENLKTRGVKEDEVSWSGVREWLKDQPGPVSKDAVLQHLRENEVKVEEVEKGTGGRAREADVTALAREMAQAAGDEWENLGPNGRQRYQNEAAATLDKPGAKFSQHTLPGGQNYRELLLTLPKQKSPVHDRLAGIEQRLDAIQDRFNALQGDISFSAHQERAKLSQEETELKLERGALALEARPVDYRSPHWAEPNVLAHVRFDDRTGPNGEKVLHVAEVQSDWHQKGRREGYQGEPIPESEKLRAVQLKDHPNLWRAADANGDSPTLQMFTTEAEAQGFADRMNEGATRARGVPNAPFKTSWHELAMKRVLRYAAEHGYDRLSWDTGDTNANRYDLSQQVHSIIYEKNPDGSYRLLAEHLGGRAQFTKLGDKIPETRLPEYVGKEVADKIALDHGKVIKGTTQRELTGLDLKVGGEGMRGFYDKILPDFVRKYTKKWGANVEDIKLPTRDNILPEGGRVPPDRMHLLSEEQKASLKPVTQDAHSVTITPEMRRSVMEGQPLFEDKPRYETEPGALDARGKPVDQTILPGAEPSAVQLAKAREAAGGGKMWTKIQQKPPGDLFGAQGVPDDDQFSLFEDEKRYNDEIPKEDRDALEKAARTGNWIGRFQATGADAEERIRASIAGAFSAWKKVGTSVPMRVREIFRSISGGGGGSGKPPITFNDVPSERPGPSFAMQIRNTASKVMDIGNDILMHVAPMSQGSVEARAAAKTFANMIRLARWHGNRMMEMLKKDFTPDELRRMWEAADDESVLRQKGETPSAGRGLNMLTPKQRRAVLEQQADAQNVWNAAINEGMVEGEGLPSYVPRMMVELAGGEVSRLGSSDEARSIPGIGHNVRTSTPQMKQRKHLTTEETEAAASTKFGTIANVVKDIRTLPLATMHLRQAVAGRALINRIKAAGQRIGEDLVVEGHEPTGSPFKWFTMDSPAFKKWRPALTKNEETGKYEQAVDQNGTPQWEKVPLYVRADFEGPLRAVLSTDTGAAYRALMSMKGRAMTAIMYSPLIHNMVEWGRAFPGAPGKVLTGIIYFQGNRAKNDPETMTEAIIHGLVPIGHQAGMQDITSIANPESIAPGRSWTAKLLGAIPGLFSRDAQQSVYRTVDAMGDLWHNTLLWDRVGDLQMGLYVHFRDNLVKKGVPQDVASYVAAHFANRYAGALPLESMSNMARKIANIAMFSRTYTLGNLGAMKDMITGLPRDVQAQIEQQGGLQQLKGVRSMAMRKAISIFLIDTSLFYASNAIFHSALSYLAGRQDLNDIEKGYVDRLMALSGKIEESPIQLLHLFDNLQALSPTSENEPGRENRVLVGYDKDGTAIYGRVVVGKIGEEFTNWLSSPIKTAISKMSTFLKPAYQLITNDTGFGRHLYDPNAKGFTGIAHNLGNIVANYFEDQIPIDSLKSAFNVLAGKGTKLDVYKTVGPLAGVTFSKGATGGPAVGEMYNIRREHDAAVAAAMPGIVEKIKGGDIAGARKAMHDLGMAPGLINYYVRVTLNPRLRLTTRTNRALIRNAPPDERARLNALRGAPQ